MRVVVPERPPCPEEVALSADARVFAAAREGVVNVWNARTGKPLASFGRKGSPIHALAVSPDGSRVAAMVRSNLAG